MASRAKMPDRAAPIAIRTGREIAGCPRPSRAVDFLKLPDSATASRTLRSRISRLSNTKSSSASRSPPLFSTDLSQVLVVKQIGLSPSSGRFARVSRKKNCNPFRSALPTPKAALPATSREDLVTKLAPNRRRSSAQTSDSRCHCCCIAFMTAGSTLVTWRTISHSPSRCSKTSVMKAVATSAGSVSRSRTVK